MVRRGIAGPAAPRPDTRRPRRPDDLSPAICRDARIARASVRTTESTALAGDASALRWPALSCDGPEPLVYPAQTHRMDSPSIQEVNDDLESVRLDRWSLPFALHCARRHHIFDRRQNEIVDRPRESPYPS